MLKTKPPKLWLLVLFCAVLVSVRVVTAQTEDVKSQEVKLYDEPRVMRWSADFLAGKREQVLRSVEADLKSSTPHPLSAYIWLRIQYVLTGKVQPLADLNDEKLKRALGVLPEVMKLHTDGEYRELLKRYSASSADKISDFWTLQLLFDAAITECRFDDAYLYAVRMAKVNPDFFYVGALFIDNLFEKERIRSKIIALFGKDGELGKTEIGRLLQSQPEISLTNFKQEERRAKFLEAWLKQFPNNPWALEVKAGRLMRGGKYDESIRLLTQADRAFPFRGWFKEIAKVMLHDKKREQAETFLRDRTPLMIKDSSAAAETSEEWIAEVLIDTSDSTTRERAETALAMVEKALARRTDTPYLLILAARASEVLESSEKMFKYAKRAVELAPDKREYFELLLSYLVNAKKYGKAQTFFKLGEKRFRQKSTVFWLLGVIAWIEHEVEPGVTNIDSIKPEVWQVLRRGQQDYPEWGNLLGLEAFLLSFVNRRAEGREKLKLSFTLSPPTPDSIEWLLRLQNDLTVEEKEAEFRALAKRYPSAVTELERHIRRLELYVQTGAADVTSVAFSQDGTILAAGTRGGDVKLWSATTGEELNTILSRELAPQGHFLLNKSKNIRDRWKRRFN